MPSCSMQDSVKVKRRQMTEDADFFAGLLDEDQDPDFLSKLLEEGDIAPKRRTRRALTDVRSLENWIKLQHTNRDCEVPLHDSVTDRPRNKGMSVIVNDIAVCRVCFLESADLES
jgi:hypothetical protein